MCLYDGATISEQVAHCKGTDASLLPTEEANEKAINVLKNEENEFRDVIVNHAAFTFSVFRNTSLAEAKKRVKEVLKNGEAYVLWYKKQ